MPDERWARLKMLFHQALDLPVDRRAAFLLSACPDDPQLREELDVMLASAEASSTFLEEGPILSLEADTNFEGAVLDGKYRLEERLGEGGMGVVYRAVHLALGRPCAVKLIKAAETANPTFLRQFALEASTLGKLRHPSIVSVTDYGVDTQNGAVPYLVMEYLEGKTLADERAGGGAMAIADALPLLEAIARAIDYAHQQGVLHGDLKPANVFLGRDGSGADRIKIVDFGLARFIEAAHAQAARDAGGTDPAISEEQTSGEHLPIDGRTQPLRAGTPTYMAPELTRGGEPSTASDIYAFGVLAFELLLGRPPFQGSSAEILNAHRQVDPPLPSNMVPGFDPELDAPLLIPLAKQVDLRPRGAMEVVRALGRLSRGGERRRWRARERPRRMFASAVAGVLVVASPLIGTLAPIAAVETRLVDLRARWSMARPPDPRILLVSIDEASLDADPTPLTGRAEEFGRILTSLVGAGARGIAVDLLLPASWSQSPVFSRFVLAHADRLTLAALSSPSGDVIGPESIAGLTAAALGPARASNLFAFVNADVDADGVARHGRLWFVDRSGEPRDTFAARASRTLPASGSALTDHAPYRSRSVEAAGTGQPGRFWIDPSLDSTRFDHMSWKDVASTVARTPAVFADRLVLLGGEFLGSGDERHPVIHRAGALEAVTGLALQSILLNTIADGFPLRERGAAMLAGTVAVVTSGTVWLVLWHSKVGLGLSVFLASMAAVLGASCVLFRESRLIVPIAAPMLVASVGLAAALALKRRLPPAPITRPEDA